jgi:hypothetical protein
MGDFNTWWPSKSCTGASVLIQALDAATRDPRAVVRAIVVVLAEGNLTDGTWEPTPAQIEQLAKRTAQCVAERHPRFEVHVRVQPTSGYTPPTRVEGCSYPEEGLVAEDVDRTAEREWVRWCEECQPTK